MNLRQHPKVRELLSVPLLEGGLFLAVAAIGWAIGRPLLFASLGPTAYEQVEQSSRRSARPYNIVVGHYVAVGAGFLSLYVIDAWNASHLSGAGGIPVPRLWASVLAVVLTAFFCLLLKASQPAALSTTLLITSGAFQGPGGAVAILLGVALLAIIGEPVRRLLERQRREQDESRGDQEKRSAA
jgi:hypothetical protein